MELIAEAQAEWDSVEHDEDEKMMLPLIRLKVSLVTIRAVRMLTNGTRSKLRESRN